jgi:anti-sigma regulatory factor (Ser/Thr protein kinase)
VTMTAARPAGTGTPGYSETLLSEPESARRARLLVSAALSAWGIGELADPGELIVSELVNNTVQHTPCHMVRILVSRPGDGVVRIGVADRSRATPELGRPGRDSEDGRGLFLVDALSWRWGYDLKR